jgi:hypothetical protein
VLESIAEELAWQGVGWEPGPRLSSDAIRLTMTLLMRVTAVLRMWRARVGSQPSDRLTWWPTRLSSASLAIHMTPRLLL